MRVGKIALVFLTVLVLLFSSYFYYKNTFSFHFVDEEDNFVLGKYLLQGEKVYQDLFAHHQPMAYIISASIQKVAHPSSINYLVLRHRQFLITWSVFWSLLLVITFGWAVLYFIFNYELLKFFMFGHLFLGESLVVYPLAFLVLLCLRKKNLTKPLTFLVGFIFSVLALLLAPIWPLLIFLFGLIVFHHRKSKNLIWLFFLGVLIPILVTLPFINLKDYFFDAFYINYQYYIPQAVANGTESLSLKAFLTPVLAIFDTKTVSSLAIFLKLSSALFLIFSIGLLVKKQYKIVVFFWLVLGLANIRYETPGQQFYNGFHLLPWVGLLLLSVGILAKEKLELFKEKKVLYLISGVLILVSAFNLFNNWSNLIAPRDMDKDWYINYSQFYQFGHIVKQLKVSQDQLLVVPDSWLVYWEADIPHASKMVNYYGWMSQVPPLNQEISKTFTDKQPAFLYCDCIGSDVEKYLVGYINVKQFDKPTSLYLSKAKIQALTPDQLDLMKSASLSI